MRLRGLLWLGVLLCFPVEAPRAEMNTACEKPPEAGWLKVDSEHATFLLDPSLRVEEVLEMYPRHPARVTIRVEKNLSAIQAAHHARYGQGTEAIAFYVMEENAVYVTARSLSESVLAHEMAHCIQDQFFGKRPPRPVEEMVAMYADQNLW